MRSKVNFRSIFWVSQQHRVQNNTEIDRMKARSRRPSRPTYTRGSKKIHPSKSQARRRFSREVKYPMYVLSVRKFIRLYSRSKFPKIETHAVLKSRGDLVMWQDVKGKIIFVSHEWAVRRAVFSLLEFDDTSTHTKKKTGIESCGPTWYQNKSLMWYFSTALTKITR